MIPSGLDAGWHVLPQDVSRASELLASGRQTALSTFQGIAADQLDASQQRLLWLLVDEFVGNADFDAADAQLALVQQTWS